LTVIQLRKLDPAHVRTFLALAEGIARRNGNRRGVGRPIALITDDVRFYNTHLHHGRKVTQRAGLFGQYNIIPSGTLIYIAPNLPAIEQAETLAHEVAHHHTVGSHGTSWRRMYAMLLVALAQAFSRRIRHDTRHVACVVRYVTPQRDNSPGGYWYKNQSTRELRDQAERKAIEQMTAASLKARKWLAVAAQPALHVYST
jgi:hypothetical protein